MGNMKKSTKALYGLGFTSQGIKDALFQVFLFFLYSQILGLDAVSTGTALFIALLFDAVSDPLVGILSDEWKSQKWGRRHPFMFASAIPLAVSLYLLFIPPAGLSQTELFLWLTVFAILVRFSLTLYIVPAMSLGAEMTDDYDERTSITSYRIAFPAFISPIVVIIGLVTFFSPTEVHTNGLFNKEAYPPFALLCGAIVIIAILISTWYTRDLIPLLPQSSGNDQKKTLKGTFSDISKAFHMRSYRALVGFLMIIYIGLGVGIVFTPYFATYFFGLSETEFGLLSISPALGGVVALIITPLLGKYLDKKNAAILVTVLFGLFFSLPFNLRYFGVFPTNDSSSLLPLYILINSIAYIFLWAALSLGNSMMAEVVDEHELATSQRQEGLFFSTMSFAYKCTIGIGSLVAGYLLNWISFPKQTAVGDVPQEAIDGLGIIGGPILLCCYLASIIFVVFYPISKGRYNEIRSKLDS